MGDRLYRRWFFEQHECAIAQYSRFQRRAGECADEDRGRCNTSRKQALVHLDSRHTGHANVGHQEEPSVRAQRFAKGVAPIPEIVLTPDKKWSDQILQSLRQRRIRDISLVLIEFACCEESPRRSQNLMQFVDDGRLADIGVAGNQHQLKRSSMDDTIEGREQFRDFTVSPIKLFGDQQLAGNVAFAECESVDPALLLRLSQTTAKILLESSGSLNSAPPQSSRAAS
jgi:hypothetical protein